MPNDNRFRYEDPRDAENEMRAHIDFQRNLYLAVAEEKAVDSYNHTFDCQIMLPESEAKKLRDYLNRIYPA